MLTCVCMYECVCVCVCVCVCLCMCMCEFVCAYIHRRIYYYTRVYSLIMTCNFEVKFKWARTMIREKLKTRLTLTLISIYKLGGLFEKATQKHENICQVFILNQKSISIPKYASPHNYATSFKKSSARELY